MSRYVGSSWQPVGCCGAKGCGGGDGDAGDGSGGGGGGSGGGDADDGGGVVAPFATLFRHVIDECVAQYNVTGEMIEPSSAGTTKLISPLQPTSGPPVFANAAGSAAVRVRPMSKGWPALMPFARRT